MLKNQGDRGYLGAESISLDAAKALFQAKLIAEGVPKPLVLDPDLARFVDELYRDTAVIGTGSTADAVRWERQFNVLLSPAGHSQKATNAIPFLRNWLNAHADAIESDIAAAKAILEDLWDALASIPEEVPLH